MNGFAANRTRLTQTRPDKRIALFIVWAFIAVSCVTPLQFIPVVSMRSQQTIELPTVADMEQLIQKHRVRVVYYTPEYFMVDINSVLYLLKSRGYTSFHDYKEGKLAKPEEYSIFKPGYPLKR